MYKYLFFFSIAFLGIHLEAGAAAKEDDFQEERGKPSSVEFDHAFQRLMEWEIDGNTIHALKKMSEINLLAAKKCLIYVLSGKKGKGENFTSPWGIKFLAEASKIFPHDAEIFPFFQSVSIAYLLQTRYLDDPKILTPQDLEGTPFSLGVIVERAIRENSKDLICKASYKPSLYAPYFDQIIDHLPSLLEAKKVYFCEISSFVKVLSTPEQSRKVMDSFLNFFSSSVNLDVKDLNSFTRAMIENKLPLEDKDYESLYEISIKHKAIQALKWMWCDLAEAKSPSHHDIIKNQMRDFFKMPFLETVLPFDQFCATLVKELTKVDLYLTARLNFWEIILYKPLNIPLIQQSDLPFFQHISPVDILTSLYPLLISEGLELQFRLDLLSKAANLSGGSIYATLEGDLKPYMDGINVLYREDFSFSYAACQARRSLQRFLLEHGLNLSKYLNWSFLVELPSILKEQSPNTPFIALPSLEYNKFVIINNMLVGCGKFECNEGLWAFSTEDGYSLWHNKEVGKFLISDKSLYVYAGKKILSLDPTDGKQKGSFILPSENGEVSTVWDNGQGTLFIGTSKKDVYILDSRSLELKHTVRDGKPGIYKEGGPGLLAIDILEGVVTFIDPDGKIKTIGNCDEEFLSVSDRQYLFYSKKAGTLIKHNLETDEEITSDIPLKSMSALKLSSDKKVLLCLTANQLVALNPYDLKSVWSTPIESKGRFLLSQNILAIGEKFAYVFPEWGKEIHRYNILTGKQEESLKTDKNISKVLGEHTSSDGQTKPFVVFRE